MPLISVCGKLLFDVNGNKEPNEDGKDIFTLRFNKSGIAWNPEVADAGSGNIVDDD